MATYGTISSSGNLGITMQTSTHAVADTPKGLLVTNAVQTKAGWIGQVIIDGDIIWESNAFDERKAAVEDANSLVVAKLKGLFA